MSSENEFELEPDQISGISDDGTDDDDFTEPIERNAKQVRSVKTDDQDDEEDDDDEDSDDSEDSESSLHIHRPSFKEKLYLIALGAVASGLGAMITYVATHKRDKTDDRLMSFMMYMVYMMQQQQNNNHGPFIQPPYTTEDTGPVPTERDFLNYVRKHGRQRLRNPDAGVEDQTFVLEPPRIHESWTVKKNLDGDIEDATRTDEYIR